MLQNRIAFVVLWGDKMSIFNLISKEDKKGFKNLYKWISIIVIILVFVTIMLMKHIIKNELNNSEKIFQQSVTQTASNIKGRIAFVLNDLQSMSMELIDTTPNLKEQEIISFLIKNSARLGYHRLIFAYPDGKALRVQKGIILSTVDWTEDKRFKKAIGGNPTYIGTSRSNDSVSRYVNKYGVPVFSKQGKIVGVLGSLYDSGAFIKVLSYCNYGEKGLVYIIGENGNYMIKPEREPNNYENLFDNDYKYIDTTAEKVKSNLKHNDKGIFKFKYKNTKYIASFSRIEGTDCHVFALMPLRDLMFDINRVLILLAIVMVIISASVIFLLYYNNKLTELNEQIIYNTAFIDSETNCINKNKFKLDATEIMKSNPGNYALISVTQLKYKIMSELYGEERRIQITNDLLKLIKNNLTENSLVARDNDSKFIILYKYQKKEFLVKYFIEKLLDDLYTYNENNMKKTSDDTNTSISTKLQIEIGVYLVDDLTLSIEQMHRRAIVARDNIRVDSLKPYNFYDNNLKIKVLKEQIIEDEMHQALAENQFQMYLQPKYNFKTNEIVGAEALVRWIHPTKGLISPVEFIPLFEKNGFIIELDKCIWEQACKYLSDRKRNEKDIFHISVNVSRLHLYNDEFINQLVELVNKYDIEPQYLELELTESVCFNNEKKLKETVQKLKQLGFTIVMDDFGTGYSSLNILRELPFDILKLDKGFVKDAFDENSKGEIVLKSIIDMANKLNMVIVAEGIETKEQAKLLKNFGCQVAQGFLYGKPMNLEEFNNLKKNNV